MTNIGFDKPLYILPFDHRGSFQTQMFGWKGALSLEQSAQIASTKQVIYDGFKTAVMLGVPKDKAGILVDEQFGAAILRDAAEQRYFTACPAEKSGQSEFDFDYGEEFDKHIEAFRPTFPRVTALQTAGSRPDSNACLTTCTARVAAYSCSSCWYHP